MAKSKTRTVLVLTAFLLAVLLGLSAPQASAATIPTDISTNWALVQITNLIDRGIVSGYPDGTFKPDNIVTRAEFISMINKAFGFTAMGDVTYTDVKAGDWFYNDIAAANSAGYIAGYTDGSMKPDNSITREEASTILATVLGLDISGYNVLPFSDAASIQVWSRNSVSALFTAGLIGGYPNGTFMPASPVTRAEAAVLMVNSLATWVPVTSISLERSALDLKVGNSLTIFAVVLPEKATDKMFTWDSEDPTVATVNSAGYITAIQPGTSNITVTTHSGGQTATCLVTVIP